MVTLMDYPAPVGLLVAAGELKMPFSDSVKYCILGISVTLLLLALGILAWQAYRCCTQTHTTYTQQDTRSSQAEGDIGEQVNFKKVDGSLRFSVYYDQLQSRLVVTVLQVEGLLDHSQTCSLQPFVKLRLMWAGSEGVEVEGCKDEKVRDFDKFSRHTVLGEVRVPLGQLNISYPLELQEDLQIPQKDLVGEVLLSLKFLPTSQRLEVGLLKVRTVLPEIRSNTALYARISVQCNQCKLRYQKTSVVARGLVTVFNEVLMFSLPESPLEQCKIMVSVYETHPKRKSTKHLIGQLTVGKEKSSEDKHWNLMMCSVRQPIAKWHGLLI
ncbi:synaptotagmin-2-like protein [Lates japonicus]|uniref:Synaptotagmin-2-like protein n=1 Tax=Lates japonicus TaxID=270547 RepID=A0AAD3N964_LATJO|nr:synaptotagmin-2-like protein [Lates japonicus]